MRMEFDIPTSRKWVCFFSLYDVTKTIEADLPHIPETVHGLVYLLGTIRLAL